MTTPSILVLPDRLDSATSPDVEARIGAALDSMPSALVLDFSGVTFVSSMGLRVLLMATKRCRTQSAKLALHSVSPQILQLFEVSGMQPFLPIYASRDVALKALA